MSQLAAVELFNRGILDGEYSIGKKKKKKHWQKKPKVTAPES